ncbi:DedA family protein [Miniphocaeibacter halophilus]|uniref:DedA family protein n=1 Tax=Miniphocaeibacter halophilus TaxID=2931922 RepID=A0AC61MRZ8_9FIRM|nr:DedA family protein [Miniphocaeibacter halophilus]QQK07365.1 DedA family protein [Miniphocaeibacter halophilus]
MEDFIIHFVDNYGYFGIFFLILIENIFPPIPSEIILGLGGFFTISTSLKYTGVVVSATLGSVIGAIILYYIGYYINNVKVRKIFRKGNKLLKIDETNLKRAKNIYLKYENISIFLCRMLPIVRSIISIPAGMFRMNRFRFILYTALGSLIWNCIITYLGVYLGDNWKYVKTIVREYSVIVVIVGILAIISYFIIKKRINKKA